jgi:hypothetical protein
MVLTMESPPCAVNPPPEMCAQKTAGETPAVFEKSDQ